jgi:protein TonB
MNRPETELEEVIVKKFKVEEPPKPKIIPLKIKIEKDDMDIVETIIDTMEPNQETEILEPEHVIVEEMDEEPIINFMVIEDVPVFPGCKNAKEKRACFSEMIQKHIQKYFRYPQLEQEMGIQGKVNVLFDINKNGSIGNIRYRGPNENLEKEAVRIISKLPKMIPGKQRGRAVKVPFAIPITFRLQ